MSDRKLNTKNSILIEIIKVAYHENILELTLKCINFKIDFLWSQFTFKIAVYGW